MYIYILCDYVLHLFVCMYIYIYIYMTCMYIYIYCIYIYIYIYTSRHVADFYFGTETKENGELAERCGFLLPQRYQTQIEEQLIEALGKI